MGLQLRPVSMNWTDQFINPNKYEAQVRANLVGNTNPIVQRNLQQQQASPAVQQSAQRQGINYTSPVPVPVFRQNVAQKPVSFWDFLAQTSNDIKKAAIDPAVEFGIKAGNTLGYIPEASAALIQNKQNDPATRAHLADMLNHSLVTNKVATGKANPVTEFLPQIAGTGLEAASYVAPIGGIGGPVRTAVKVLAQGGVNSGVGATQSALNQYNETGKVDPMQVLKSGIVGGVIGAAVPTAEGIVNKAKAVHASDMNPERGSIKLPGGENKPPHTTKAYGKTIEMTPENGYIAAATPDGGVVYSKTVTTGSNTKGTRQPTTSMYASDGTKLTKPQFDAYIDGTLKTQKPASVKAKVSLKKQYKSDATELAALTKKGKTKILDINQRERLKELKTKKQDNPYSATNRPLTATKELLDIKISRTKNATRKAELMAERQARFGKRKVSKKQKPEGDAYDILSSQSKAEELRNKGNPISNTIEWIKGHLVDPYAPLAKSDRLSKVTKGGEKLTKLANDVRNSAGITDDMIRHQTLKDGRTLQQVMKKYPNGDRMKNFLIYVQNKSDLENRGFKDGVKHNPDLTNSQVRKAVKDFEAVNKGAEADARTIKYFKDHMEQQGVQHGTLKKADADSAQASRQYYFPSKQVETGAVKTKVQAGLKGSKSTQTVVQARKGGGTVDYSWGAVTKRFGEDTHQNLQSRFYRELAKRADNGTINARRIKLKTNDAPAGFDPESPFGKNLYHGLENGDHTTLALDRNLAKTFERLSANQARDVALSLSTIPANVAKVIYTGILNPIFHAINLVKNPFVAIHNRGIGVIGARPLIAGMQGVFNKGKFSEHALVKHGANTVKATQSVSTHKINAELLALDKGNLGELAKFTLNHPWTSVKAVGRAIDHVLAASDRSFRSMAAKDAYLKAKKAKMSEKEALETAADVYNESMGNFNRVTNTARSLEPILLYSGATQAGARAWAKAYRDRPFQTLLMDAAFVGGVGALVANTNKTEEGKKFYDDMEKSGKQYIIDDNIVMVLPGAHKNETTGEWVGVVKVPLAPDFRPMNRAVRKVAMGQTPNAEDLTGHLTGDVARSTREIPTNNPAVSLASTAMNRDSRTGEQIVSKFEQDTKKPADQKDAFSSDVAVSLGSTLNVSPKQIDAFLNNMGLTGDVLQNRKGNALATLQNSLEKQFGKGITGQSDGAKYYKDLTEVAKSIKNEADYVGYTMLHTKNDDKTIDSPSARAKLLLASPDLLRAENDLNKRSVARGEASNPFYDLPADQQQKVLRYRSSKDLTSAKQAYDKNGEPLFTSLGLDNQWYTDFKDRETVFYDGLNAKNTTKLANLEESFKGDPTNKITKGKIDELKQTIARNDDPNTAAATYSGATKPKDKAMEALQTQYFALDKAGRRALLAANPTLKDYWAQQNDFNDAERVALGLKTEGESSASGNSNYASYGSSSGGGSSSSGINPYGYEVKRGGASIKLSAPAKKKLVALKSAKASTAIAKPKVSIKKAVA